MDPKLNPSMGLGFWVQGLTLIVGLGPKGFSASGSKVGDYMSYSLNSLEGLGLFRV